MHTHTPRHPSDITICQCAPAPHRLQNGSKPSCFLDGRRAHWHGSSVCRCGSALCDRRQGLPLMAQFSDMASIKLCERVTGTVFSWQVVVDRPKSHCLIRSDKTRSITIATGTKSHSRSC